MQFVWSSIIGAPVERVFAFHESADALQRLLPPWQDARVVRREGGLAAGALVELELRLGPIRQRWVARHTEYSKNGLFADVQERGPFRTWRHRHEFDALGPELCRLTDRVEFSLPGGRLVDWLLGWLARWQLRRMFEYRHRVTDEACR